MFQQERGNSISFGSEIGSLENFAGQSSFAKLQAQAGLNTFNANKAASSLEFNTENANSFFQESQAAAAEKTSNQESVAMNAELALGNPILSGVKTAYTGISNTFSKLGEAKTILSEGATKLQAAGENALSTIKSLPGQITDRVSQIGADLQSRAATLQSVVKSSVGKAQNAVSTAVDEVKATGQGAITDARTIGQNAIDQTTDLGTGALQQTTDLGADAMTQANNVRDVATTELNSNVSDLQNSASAFGDEVRAGGESFTGDLQNTVSNLGGQVDEITQGLTPDDYESVVANLGSQAEAGAESLSSNLSVPGFTSSFNPSSYASEFADNSSSLSNFGEGASQSIFNSVGRFNTVAGANPFSEARQLGGSFNMPSLDIPSLPSMSMPSLPSMSMPSLPSVDMPSLPSINMPTFNAPTLPSINMPSVNIVTPNADETISAATTAGENLAAKGTSLVSETAGAASNIASSATAAGSELAAQTTTKLASTAADLTTAGESIGSDLLSAGEAALTDIVPELAIPGIGEAVGAVAGVAAAGYGIYEGLKDLFSPSGAGNPTLPPTQEGTETTNMANAPSSSILQGVVNQGFQSGL